MGQVGGLIGRSLNHKLYILASHHLWSYSGLASMTKCRARGHYFTWLGGGHLRWGNDVCWAWGWTHVDIMTSVGLGWKRRPRSVLKSEKDACLGHHVEAYTRSLFSST